MNRNILSALLLVLLPILAIAQTFNWEAKLAPVNSHEFYNILLTPEITTHLKQNLSDIRIYSSEGKEIPYIIKSENSASSTSFMDYSILENRSIPKCCTHLILHNTSKTSINNISLIIKNSDVRKRARLSGSDDQQNWYIIKDDYNLESIYNDRTTSEVKILNFPLSDYEYYKLEIDDSLNAPIKILKAGFYDAQYEEAKYLPLPTPVVQQKDSIDKFTYLKISYKNPHFVDRIKVDIKSPEYFLRKARVCKLIKDKKNTYFETIQNIELRSNHENIFLLDYVIAQELYLIIENKDNQPLEITDITGYQLTHYLTAKLEAGKSYVLRFGNKDLPYPQYDLQFFKDNIPSAIQVLKAEKPVTIEKKESKAVPSNFFSTTLWIWGAIALVIIFLGYLSYKMIGEIKKE